ncbi:AraC family transcriptional regulator [Lactobacillus hamsteri]|uniref:ArsR family transcriptional regulator n=1 Tax=Lactobacillus hamsteri DSM 5661 = JCM 6256 TaxID=1423754 RepID=A0A0R1YNX9_9LACO|nr:AraC family transcriptional regulator [Lactobacillus hamsteri]KRM40947.1 ArsR family transcriptional regulator [Lactobacillus hamsteri DSM 5661 = JCM 6256]
MLEKIEAVQRMQDYIKKHLFENITLADLSKVSLYSPWYSYRLFIDQIGMTPARYIRRLRLSQSALRLRDDKCKIINVAFDMGFKSVDGYQRAFKSEFNCNPSDYVANPRPIYLFYPYGVKFKPTERRQKIMNNIRDIFIQQINKPKRKVIIKRGIKATDYLDYCDEVGCDVWGLLKSIKSISGEPVCLWLPPKYRKPKTSEYVQGVEVSSDYNGEIPEGFDVIELPEAKYLMFQGEPFKEEDHGIAIKEIRAAIKKYNPEIIGYVWDKSNPRIQLEPIGSRGYIEMVPVNEK